MPNYIFCWATPPLRVDTYKHTNGIMNGCIQDSDNMKTNTQEPDGEEKQKWLEGHEDVAIWRPGFERKITKERGPLLGLLSGMALLASACALTYVIVTCVEQHSLAGRLSSITGDQVVTYPEVCLDCVRLAKNPYQLSDQDRLLEALTKRREGVLMKCCASNSTQMSAMLEAVARKQETIEDPLSEVYPGVQKSSSVSLHKHMVSASKSADSDYSVVNFNTSKGPLEQSAGVKLLPDGVVIATTGIYYVYSNLLYNASNMKQQIWSSCIYRTSLQATDTTGILLKSIHTECASCRQDVETSFIGGVFLLQKGDFIQVRLNAVDPIQFNNDFSYLGLAMLTSRPNGTK